MKTFSKESKRNGKENENLSDEDVLEVFRDEASENVKRAERLYLELS
jgi:hypothetical protein